jgi:beta-glucosidase
MAFMTGYQSIDGQPSTMNHWLLSEKLKEEWGFEGILVTDYDNVGALVKGQQVCADYAEASAVAIKAGNDMIMATPDFFDGCQEALRRGLLSEAELDATVRRVLSLKVRMGLFEDPGRSDKERITRVIGCLEHRAVNLRAARESLVLLKNSKVDGRAFLPLDPSMPRKLAVVGPNADAPLAQLGDWSLGSGQMTSPSGEAHPRASIVTPMDGIKAALPALWRLVALEEADIVLLVAGDSLNYIGERHSTATLELQDGQVELCDRIAALGKRTIVALVNSKPLVLPKSILGADAIFECFNPGMMGGAALAEAIFGVLNPSGKLAISIPRHAGQQPVYYNQTRGQHGSRYADLTQESAFSFGFGLSYSRFEYGMPRLLLDRLALGDTLKLLVEVHNASDRAGVEIVQLYVEDEVTSLTWASRELVAFSRVELGPRESKRVELEVPVSELWIVDGQGSKVVEPGYFRALVGSSSRTADLQALRFSVG